MGRLGKTSSETRTIVSAQIANYFGTPKEQLCPRCEKPTREGLVITLNGPFQGLRCHDCWELEI
jgi:transposase-like protein